MSDMGATFYPFASCWAPLQLRKGNPVHDDLLPCAGCFDLGRLLHRKIMYSGISTKVHARQGLWPASDHFSKVIFFLVCGQNT